MKWRNWIELVVIPVFLAAGGAWLLAHHRAPAVTPVVSKPQSTQAAHSAPLDRLQIEAIRQRSYTASPITIEQNLGDQGGYTTSIVSYNSDGFKIYALEAVPAGAKPTGGWPVIVLNHGYINPAAYQTAGTAYEAWVAALARAGFMVIKPDYRGNGKSQGQPEGGHFSPVYAYDVLNLVASLKQAADVNPNRIGMLGHSMGGHETLRALVASKDIKASVIASGVVGSFDDIFYHWPNSPAPSDQPLSLVQGIRQQEINAHGTPASNPDFWNSASAINYVSAIAGPVQVDVDASDAVVPKAFSDELVAALKKSHKSVQYYVYPGNDHNLANSQSLFLQRAISFFKQNL